LKTEDFAKRGYLRKALSEDKTAVISAIDLTPVVQEMLDRCDDFPASLNHRAQACLGALLLQSLSDTDENEKFELQWHSTGDFGNLFADALGTGRIRSTIQRPKAEVASLKVSLGPGVLQIRRSLGTALKSNGLVQSKGWVAQDLVAYLRQSEQRNCGLNLHVGFEEQSGQEKLKVQAAVGFLIHVLPVDHQMHSSSDPLELSELWDHRMKIMGPLSEWKLPSDPQASTQSMIEWLTVGSKPLALQSYPIGLYCTCSEERAARAVGLLTPREKNWMLKDHNEEVFEVNCEYCGAVYKLKRPTV
jgi:redox-regulated HSP33 family molecular chaperone